MLITLRRILKLSFQSFWRNIWLSLITIFIIFLALFSISMLVNLNILVDVSIESIKEKVDLSLYFKSEVTQEEVVKIKSELENLVEVESINFISRDQALNDLKEKQKGNDLIIKSIQELDENPLGDSLTIKARNIEDYKEIILYISGNADYEAKIWNQEFDEDYNEIVDKLESVSSRIEQIGFFIIALFVIIAFLIIFNTIRIGIYTYREEIGVMKLVGAKSNFVRAPFLVETIVFIIIAWVINTTLFFVLAKTTQLQISTFIGNADFSLLEHYLANFGMVFGWQLILVILLGMVSCTIAIRRYLRV
ncbi:MAG: permease-like cell division protein FtsX [Patescibacteria group bacterium]|jgi:cell division transport system permease protein|nr:permease-like cell division protein FtsX [Patescibacteria group bacterium]